MILHNTHDIKILQEEYNLSALPQMYRDALTNHLDVGGIPSNIIRNLYNAFKIILQETPLILLENTSRVWNSIRTDGMVEISFNKNYGNGVRSNNPARLTLDIDALRPRFSKAHINPIVSTSDYPYHTSMYAQKRTYNALDVNSYRKVLDCAHASVTANNIHTHHGWNFNDKYHDYLLDG